MQFDIKLKSQDMYRFNMYQTYTGFHGWFSIIVSIIIFIVAGLTYGGLDITYTVLYIAFGIIFLLYMPVTLWLRFQKCTCSIRSAAWNVTLSCR